jgi:hypothetical protein
MKALSLKQPWANWIVNGIKTIETRTWNTKFRGRFLIHASTNVDKVMLGEMEPTGCLIGLATLVRVKIYNTESSFVRDFERHRVPWHPKQFPIYGYILEDVKAIKTIPFKGALNFFETNLTQWDIRTLDSIEYLKCQYCGHLNELVWGWRSMGDEDDTHYITCDACKRNLSINNQDRKSPYLVKGLI